MFTNYPVGHPTLVHFDKDVDWCKPADMVGEDGDILEGIIKCFVVPPRHVHCDIPVLPLRMNKRTLFPLCRKCSELFPNGAVDREYSCPHFEDEERGFSVTIPHIELAEALKAGYRVTRVYRAYVWPLASDWSPFLFHTYLEKFLKMKFEASGYPAACSEEGITEEEAAARKKAYIDKAWSVCQVRLNPDRIKYNAGLRYVAKLCLNSLWGRFALRNRLTKTEIIDNHADDGTARKDTRVLYMDTDSTFYEYETALGDPLPGGEQLGELTDEYPSHTIVEMVVEKWGAVDNYCSFNYPSKNFRITKKGDIFTVPLTKRFNPTVNKGVIRDDGLRGSPLATPIGSIAN
uniref:DNA-directed DNA polymerase n=1 Tax=Globodera pallida TaxID=36090 RepID=A0A183CGF4_GLOPA